MKKKMPGDVLDLGWVYKHTKGHVLFPSHLTEMSVILLVLSFVPKRVGIYFRNSVDIEFVLLIGLRKPFED